MANPKRRVSYLGVSVGLGVGVLEDGGLDISEPAALLDLSNGPVLWLARSLEYLWCCKGTPGM